MRSIRAAVVREKGGPFLVESITLDDPRDNEVLIRIAGVGMCHTDLVVRDRFFPTPLPAVLGHEGAGIVEKVGARKSKPDEAMTSMVWNVGTQQNVPNSWRLSRSAC